MGATSGKRSAIALAALLVVRIAGAEPSPNDIATARELYKQGADALEAGNAEVAVEKLTQAWALVHTPVIGLDLARAQSKLGHLVEAREAALSVQRLVVSFDETARSTEARSDAAKIADALEPRIPHIVVTVDGLAGHAGTVKLDGSTIPAVALAAPRQTNPGSHVATVDTDDGRHAEGTLVLGEHETNTLPLHLEAPAPPPPEVKPETNPDAVRAAGTTQAPARKPESRIAPFVWVSVVVTGVGLVTGALTGALAMNESSIVHGNCNTASTTGDSKILCLPPYTGDLAAANTLATVSTIGFVATGVGALALIGWFVFAPSSSSAKTGAIVPFIGPVSGLRGTF
jgi:hypothetical protein